MSDERFLRVAAGDGRALLDAAERDWSRAIRHCPGWDAAHLVGHVGSILAWIGTIVATREYLPREQREVPPAHTVQLRDWYTARLDRTLETLRSTGVDTRVWTFSGTGDHRAGWWIRRTAVELSIHRWDAQYDPSSGSGTRPAGIDRQLAAAGIEEFSREFLPGLLARDRDFGWSGTLRLHADDLDRTWCLDLGDSDSPAGSGQPRVPDASIEASGSDLLLWLTNRRPRGPVRHSGSASVLDGWTRLRR